MYRNRRRTDEYERVMAAVCGCREGQIDAPPGQPCHRSIRVWLRSPGASLNQIGVSQAEFDAWDEAYCRIHPEAKSFQLEE